MVDIAARAAQIRSEVTVNGNANFAEAMARLFEDATITDPVVGGTNTPLARRLVNILESSGDAYSNGISHFSGIFHGWYNADGAGDTGFKSCFQDHMISPGSSMQVCHAFTAMDMGYRPITTYLFIMHSLHLVSDALKDEQERVWGRLGPAPVKEDPDKPMRPGWWTPDELECVKLMIAHERVPDSGVYGAPPTTFNKARTAIATVLVSDDDCDRFRQGYVSLGSNLQFDLAGAQGKIATITIGNGQNTGNSLADLLLSAFGFRFGMLIRNAQFTSLADGGNWVRGNLKNSASTP